MGKEPIVIKDLSEKTIFNTFESSLKRLNVDNIFSLYIHYPDPNTPINKAIDSLIKIKDQKLVKKSVYVILIMD